MDANMPNFHQVDWVAFAKAFTESMANLSADNHCFHENMTVQLMNHLHGQVGLKASPPSPHETLIVFQNDTAVNASITFSRTSLALVRLHIQLQA
jgi:hypothetical protein